MSISGSRIFFASVALALCGPAHATEAVTYGYDALGRLVAASHLGTVNNGQNTAVSPDLASNRTNYTVTTATGVGLATPALSIAGASVVQGGNLVFAVTRTGNPATAVSAHWATAGGTAISGSDFTAGSGTVSFAAGQTSTTISVVTINHRPSPGQEAMTVTLSAPSGATLGTAVGTGTIINNPAIWASTLTAGSWSNCSIYFCVNYTGYMPPNGAMSTTQYGNLTITNLATDSWGFVGFTLSGSSAPANSGWTSITIPGLGTFARSAGGYSTSGNTASWSWIQPGTTVLPVTSGTVTIQ